MPDITQIEELSKNLPKWLDAPDSDLAVVARDLIRQSSTGLRALLDEVTRLREELNAAERLFRNADEALRTISVTLGGSDEWSDQRQMILDVHRQVAEAEAELARLRAPAGDVGEVVKRLLSYRPTYGWPEETATTVEPTLNVVAADLLLRQAGEIEAKDKHIELLQSKIDAEKSCACSFDRPGDVCAVHSPLLREAGDRINQLIDALGSTSMGQKDGARRSALKFLAKL